MNEEVGVGEEARVDVYEEVGKGEDIEKGFSKGTGEEVENS